jgi:hypothetical protein
MQPSSVAKSKIKVKSLILIACAMAQLAISLAVISVSSHIDAEIFLLVFFLTPQVFGSLAVWSYAHKPTNKKYTPQYFAILVSITATLVLVWAVVLYIPNALTSSEFILLRVAFFLRGLLPCIWLVAAIVYVFKVLRQT